MHYALCRCLRGRKQFADALVVKHETLAGIDHQIVLDRGYERISGDLRRKIPPRARRRGLQHLDDDDGIGDFQGVVRRTWQRCDQGVGLVGAVS